MTQKITSKRAPILEHLKDLEKKCKDQDPTLQEVFLTLGEDSHYALIVFLIIPFLQPIPLMGLSTPFGILIAMVAVFAFLERPPFIPKRWQNKIVSGKTVSMIAEGAEKVFRKVSKILHPRWDFLFYGPFRYLNTFLLCANAIALALPLPIPFSNAIPAWMIFFQTLAHLEEDGLFIILSYIQTIIAIVYFTLLATGAIKGLEMIGS